MFNYNCLLALELINRALMTIEATDILNSTDRQYVASHVLDGDIRSAPDTCFCCTRLYSTGWIELDLGAIYVLSKIVIRSRTDRELHVVLYCNE